MQEFLEAAARAARKTTFAKKEAEAARDALAAVTVTKDNVGAVCNAIREIRPYETIAMVLGPNWLKIGDELHIEFIRNICNDEPERSLPRSISLAAWVVTSDWRDCQQMLLQAKAALTKKPKLQGAAINALRKTWLRPSPITDDYPFAGLHVEPSRRGILGWLLGLVVKAAVTPATKAGLTKPDKEARKRLGQWLSDVSEKEDVPDEVRGHIRELAAAADGESSAGRTDEHGQSSSSQEPGSPPAGCRDGVAPDGALHLGVHELHPFLSERQAESVRHVWDADRVLTAAIERLINDASSDAHEAFLSLQKAQEEARGLSKRLEAAEEECRRNEQKRADLAEELGGIQAELATREREVTGLQDRVASIENQLAESETALAKAQARAESIDKDRIEQREAAAEDARQALREELANHIRHDFQQFEEIEQDGSGSDRGAHYRSLLRNIRNGLRTKGIRL